LLRIQLAYWAALSPVAPANPSLIETPLFFGLTIFEAGFEDFGLNT
jgi:hypothetical protein